MEAILALADGTVFRGRSFGATGEAVGEVVFNTAITGYQEILTDPSYSGQIVTMTNPLIGNTGINQEDVESHKPWVEGLVIKEESKLWSNWRGKGSLGDYLRTHGIVGIDRLDTRALVSHIRDRGEQMGVISTQIESPDKLIQKAKETPGLAGRDLVSRVTCSSIHEWNEGIWNPEKGYTLPSSSRRYHVAALDFGIKTNILRNLAHSGFEVTVYPAQTSHEELLAGEPDAVFLSNGPGDPAGVPYAAETIRNLIGRIPIFGICLGHQLLALALGAKTYKLKFGHHGANHPVKDLATGKIEITSQNHGFAVDAESLPKELLCTHMNLNDDTVEGLRHRELPIFSVQYHPEASPGPHDSLGLFEQFAEMLERTQTEIGRRVS